MKTYTTDAIVIGSGAAGMATALALAPLRVMLVTKTPGLAGGSTAAAQGGIATVHTPDDSPEKHAADTHFAGAGLANKEAVKTLTEDGADTLSRLLAMGMPLDRAPDGSISAGLEAAHSVARIIHAGGDATGWHLATTLATGVRQARHIDVLTDTMVLDLAVENGRTVGAWGWHDKHGFIKLQATHVVLATGGSGQLYSHTTNPTESTADGQALAYRAGATLTDMEFVQFHPTALAVEGEHGEKLSPQPLLTEALRGAGAKLVNNTGERFMLKQHQDAELAPRDVVARGIWAEAAAGRSPCLDARHIENVAKKFPTVTKLCKNYNLNPQTDLLPVAPAAHYHMGGVKTSTSGETDVPGLWAVGEVACTGVHGANRLASNSLLECLVFASRAAEGIKKQPGERARMQKSAPPALPKNADGLTTQLRDVMYEHGGLMRDEKSLLEGLTKLDVLGYAQTNKNTDTLIRPAAEFANMMTVAKLILEGALQRKESRGGHARSDYKTPLDVWKKHIEFNIQSDNPNKQHKDNNAHEKRKKRAA